MKQQNRRNRAVVRVLFAAALLVTLASAPRPLAAQMRSEATTIFLVRHAERADDDPRDPGLNAAGQARVVELTRMLANAGITAVFSTSFRRTMDTARPIASQAGVEIESYDPRSPEAMQAFVEKLKSMNGRILVSGHSNTTPALVEALGGDVVIPMTEADYDRLYILTIGTDGKVSSTLVHFGARATG